MIESPIITLDVDWAPNFVIDEVSDFFMKSDVKTTWFITHDFQGIKKLRENDLFELGIHPNFTKGSTQGENPVDILKNLKNIVPESKSVRTHSLMQSSPLLSMFHKFGIENDVSLFLENTPNLQPHYSKYFKLYRFPFFWEDDIAMNTGFSKKEISVMRKKPGLKIFNFHPIHVYLNSRTMENYKEVIKSKRIDEIEKSDLDKYRNTKYGTRNFLEDLIYELESNQTYSIIDLQMDFKNRRHE